MNSTTLSKILLVQALEESDPHGHHLPLSTRHHATQQARDQHDPASDHSTERTLSFLTARSDIMWAFVQKAFPAFAESWKCLQVDIPSLIVAIPALIGGLLINGLGESQRVNLLNFPLLLLLMWNVGIYLSSALKPILKSSVNTIWLDTAATWASKRAEMWRQRSWPTGNRSDPWVQQATTRFTTLWWPHIQPLWTGRLRQLLHLGAACMVMGMILGMYTRGLALDYQATWESTFLSATQVHGILHILLGPAAWLLQYSFPEVSEIVRLQGPQHGPAAQWIHLWAITALIVIIIPRSVMVWLSQRSLNQAKETLTLPLGDPYFIHLLIPDRGQSIHIDVLPYSYLPSPDARNFLDLGLLDLFGNLATVHWQPTIPFGQEFSNSTETSAHVRTSVVIFNAGQTPEAEVHGEWLHSVQTQMGTDTTDTRLLVLLDEEPYSQVIGENRVIERQQAWQDLMSQYHLSLVPFNANTTVSDQFLQQTQVRLWPASP